MSEYRIKYYKNSRTGKEPVLDYLKTINSKDSAKIERYVELLKEKQGYLEEPFSRHVKGKIRELRVDFAGNRHRVFYFVFIGKTIIFLHAFLKKTRKTPRRELKNAINNYHDFMTNQDQYDF